MRGRKLCTSRLHQGPRWLPLLYFGVKEWGDNTHTWVVQYQSWCISCHRIYSRRRKAIREGRDPDKTKPYNGEISQAERKRRKAEEYQRRMARPGKRRENRKRQREAAAGRRREAGVPERGSWSKYRITEDKRQMLNAEPFLKWLDQYKLETGAQISESDQRVLLHSQISGTIALVQVDRILIRLGRPDILGVLYEA